MSALDGPYPAHLTKVLEHAKRLTKVLAKIERAKPDAWSLGRAGELRGVVSLALADWRAGASDVDATGQAILAYVDAIHRGASQRLRCGLALECCEFDDVITAVAPGDAGLSGVDTATMTSTLVTHGPTQPAEWVDRPEVLERLRYGLPLVETLARSMAGRIGQRHANLDDLRAFGREGLLEAARAFDEGRAVPFERWASLRIRNAMIDGVRRFGAVPRRARQRLALEGVEDAGARGEDAGRREDGDSSGGAGRSAGFGEPPMELEDVAGSGLAPDELLEKAQRLARVRDIVAQLPDRERALIEQSYFHGATLEEAAASMGFSRSWAQRAHARAMATVERELRKREAPTGAHGRATGPRS